MRFTFEQINGEEIRSTRITISAVVREERILPEPMSAYGGRRCAFPPYGPWVDWRIPGHEPLSKLGVFGQKGRVKFADKKVAPAIRGGYFATVPAPIQAP